MKPAVCVVCGNRPSPDGDWVRFSDYTPPADGELTHPEGLEYFCADHISQAKALAHLAVSEALRQISTSE